MIWQLDFWLLILVVITAIVALQVRDLLAAVAVLTAYSFFMALLFAELGAVDVSMTEASLGAGITGVLFVSAIYIIGRRSRD